MTKSSRRSGLPQRVRLAEVAGAADVSTATVSRVINSPDRVKPAVRRRVLEAIDKLGYVPHGSARALALQKTGTMAAIVPTIESSLFAKVITAFQERLNQNGFDLLLATTEYHSDREHPQILSFLKRGIEGILLVGRNRPPESYKVLRSMGVPYMTAMLCAPESEHPYCGYDHLAPANFVVEHLVSSGHTRFCLLTGRLRDNDRAAARVEAARNAAKRLGIEIDPANIIECPYTISGAKDYVRALLCRPARPTAILCANDILALGAILAARELGLEVPDDVSVVGHGDFDMSALVSPPLSTIRTPDVLMGQCVADYLIAMAKGVPAQSKIELPCEILLRGTTARAPNSIRPVKLT